MDLVHIRYNDRYRSKMSISNILCWPVGHKGQKLDHKVKHEYSSEGTVLMQSSLNYVRMFISIKSRPGRKLGHVGSKTRSKGQLKEKPCELFSRHSFDPFFMKL